jgi:hypothetical protein
MRPTGAGTYSTYRAALTFRDEGYDLPLRPSCAPRCFSSVPAVLLRGTRRENVWARARVEEIHAVKGKSMSAFLCATRQFSGEIKKAASSFPCKTSSHCGGVMVVMPSGIRCCEKLTTEPLGYSKTSSCEHREKGGACE